MEEDLEDKRILKTKKTIRSTLIEMLQQKPFEKITVAEICRRGMISRITFYTHYEDKYARIEELFSEYTKEAVENYHALQGENNPANDGMTGYLNLLDAILCVFFDHYLFFSHTTTQKSAYLHSAFFKKLFDNLDHYLEQHKSIVPRFPSRQTAALLCSGLFGVINTCIKDHLPESDIRSMAREMYLGILESSLFSRNQEAHNPAVTW